ncbi:hypothetical protein DY000_02048439 [Brassica cretica]|uniref:Uncharacterized protein n=1 Tax=Brassica cretica TaxID=69181 RepID=A0ABQ7EUI1_BRACR|nr:hypothetical protein DY000_02048439 [Brassica cretica]
MHPPEELMIHDSSQHATVELSDWENDFYNPTMAMHTATLHTEEYDEDYEEERAIEYIAILAEEDRLLHHSSWKRNVTSIDKTIPTSIDTHLHQTSCKRSSTDISYYPSINTGVDSAREGDYSIGSWANDYYHERFAVETSISQPCVDELHECFTTEKLLNIRERDEVDQHRAEACGEGTCFSRSFTRDTRASIDIDIPSSIDRRPEFGKRAYDRDGTRRFH